METTLSLEELHIGFIMPAYHNQRAFIGRVRSIEILFSLPSLGQREMGTAYMIIILLSLIIIKSSIFPNIKKIVFFRMLSSRRSTILKCQLALVSASVFSLYLYYGGAGQTGSHHQAESYFARHLLAADDETVTVSTKQNTTTKLEDEDNCGFQPSDSALFPSNTFNDEQLGQGAIVLYIIGVLYMFYALAIICDHFFVPSLEVIIEKFNISQVKKNKLFSYEYYYLALFLQAKRQLFEIKKESITFIIFEITYLSSVRDMLFVRHMDILHGKVS